MPQLSIYHWKNVMKKMIYMHKNTSVFLIQKNINEHHVLYAKEQHALVAVEETVPLNRFFNVALQTKIEQMLSDNIEEISFTFSHQHKNERLHIVQLEKNLYVLSVVEETQPVVQENLDPIITISPENEIISINKAVTTIFGYKNQFLKGQLIHTLFKLKKSKNLLYTLNKVKKFRESEQCLRCQIQNIEGKCVPVVVKAIPIVENNELIEIQCIVRLVNTEENFEYAMLSATYHDQLTGVWNKRALLEHYTSEQIFVHENEGVMGLLNINITRFRRVNAKFGSGIGDKILIGIVSRLAKLEDEYCTLYRQNGDKFIMLMRYATKHKLIQQAQNIQLNLLQPFIIAENEVVCDCSIGISIEENGVKQSIEQLLSEAATASNVAKQKNVGKYLMYDSTMSNLARENAMMEAHLRRAIEKNELYLHFQPQVDLETEIVHSFEALLRWKNPLFGHVSPAQFIPIAEESDIILSLGDWVLEQCVKLLKSWKERNIEKYRIAVNISPKQFQQVDFIKKINYLLMKYQINPSCLELEITESSMMDVDQTMSQLYKLKAMGVIISIDDFGTGYSSLNYIKSYPIDIIKIDQSFIREMPTDKKDKAIARTIIHLAHSLDLTVIAEGVETSDHVNILLEYDCEKAQGYYFSRPVTLAEIEKNYINNR